jgi:hypothetical protein
MMMIIEGLVLSTPTMYDHRQARIEIKSLGPDTDQTVIFPSETTFGAECLTMDFVAPYSLVSKESSIVFSLSKKDFVEVIYY